MRGEVTQNIFSRLDRVALYSCGVFYKGSVCKSPIERTNFGTLLRQNSEYFETKFHLNKNLSPKIYQLKREYYLKRELSWNNFCEINNYMELLRAFIWSVLIMEQNIDKKIPSSVFKLNGADCLLDNLENSKLLSKKLMVTTLYREEFWSKQGVEIIVPEALRTRRLKEIVEELHYLMDFNALDPTTWKLNDWRLLPKGKWIVDDNLLHKDKREYPGLGSQSTGLVKKKIDYGYLKKLSEAKPHEHLQILEDYRIGQWPI